MSSGAQVLDLFKLGGKIGSLSVFSPQSLAPFTLLPLCFAVLSAERTNLDGVCDWSREQVVLITETLGREHGDTMSSPMLSFRSPVFLSEVGKAAAVAL